ncbi:Allergen Asp f 4 [Lachnellula arida]|uniref:Allergen Asp f 4 n=1 Tax=Lachnellula arida TaxID=1316785 RepID=A0A8T9B952_9HELO|nr:Allergen Asp f 4 [Lachnellula arida]
MRYSITSAGMVLAAMTIGEAVAGPTHAHLHRRVHELEKKTDWSDPSLYKGVDFAKAYSEGMESKTSVAVAASTVVAGANSAQATASSVASTVTSSAAAKTSAASSSIESEAASILAGLWKDLVGLSNSRTAFGPGIAPVGTPGDNYFGNYGGTGDDYGSNVILVDSIGDNQFTNTFKNTQSVPITVNVWNKVGPDYQVLSGAPLAPTKTTLTFVLQPGASQIVAFQDISNIGWAEPVEELTGASAYATSWGEANFVSTGSGYDVSAINDSKNYNMTITSTENSGCTSDTTQNTWKSATDAVGESDGTDTNGSCYVPGSSLHLQTTMGGSS